jgi:hypothetical protein
MWVGVGLGVKDPNSRMTKYGFLMSISRGYFTRDIFIWRCQTPEYILLVDAEIPNYCLFG